jgi:hypothetical protein
MNGAATISPLWVPNLCTCGHDLLAHTMTVSPNNCTQCLRQGGVINIHNFVADGELWPSVPFTASDPSRIVCAGGQGFNVQATTTATGNNNGATTVTFVSLPSGIIVPGWTFTTIPTSGGGNNARQATYYVRAISGNSITIDPPGLVGNTPSIICNFQGSIGSTMGPGRPPNGQRAG